MKLEICANSFQSALNAQTGGADRIELCSELSVGGVTPSFGLLKKVKEHINIPIHVLIRPRSGNFVYSETEFEQMKSDIEVCKEFGFEGIVSGVLHNDHTLDEVKTRELVELSRPLSFTFHRAFDCVPDPKKSLKTLINIGVERVLTSGQKESAIEGIELLKELKQLAGKNIIILPGGGINASNAKEFQAIGIQEVHASCSKEIIAAQPFYDNTSQTISDLEIIKSLVQKLKDE